MLSEMEMKGIRCILEKLSNSNLDSVAFTTTKGLIKPETRSEAIKAIINYSESAYALLKRRKILKEHLFNYLNNNKIVVSVTSDKWILIKECLKLWNSDTSQVEEINDDYLDVEEISSNYKMSRTNFNSVTPSTSHLTSVAQANTDRIVIRHATQNASNVSPSLQQQCNILQINIARANFEATLVQPSMQNVDNFSPPLQQQHIVQTNSILLDNNVLDEMGKKFAEWFYDLINKISLTPNNFGPEHFWPDCTLIVREQQANSVTDKQFANANDVAMYFIQLIAGNCLFFQPNKYHGTRCATEIHGLVKIGVSGVLHQGNNCVGLFDQIFGLVRSAGCENNWKIKYSELLLKVKDMRSQICN